MPVRDWRLFVALKIPSTQEQGKSSPKELYATVREILHGAQLSPVATAPPKLLDWMRKLFNDQPMAHNDFWDEERPMRKQVILADTVIEKSMNHLKLGSRFFRSLTAKKFTREVDLLKSNELFGGA